MTRNTTAQIDTHRLLLQHGWEPATRNGQIAFYYRWDGAERHELHLTWDPAGRLRCWSHWVNVRHTIDQEPGLRERLHDHIRSSDGQATH